MTPRSNRLIIELGQTAPVAERERQLRRFARQYEWEPSDLICEDEPTQGTSTAHIVVEYGLQQSAVLTFLREDRPFGSLSSRDRDTILRISYNNAVDWHLVLDVSNTSYLNNRLKELQVVRHVAVAEDPDGASARSFPKYTSARVRHQLQRVDDAIIESIDYWRRRLSAAIGQYDINANLSALFNAVIFLRVLEDQRTAAGQTPSETLASIVDARGGKIREVFRASLKSLGKSDFPKFLRDKAPLLDVFDSVPEHEIASLVRDFYVGVGCPYPYDFSLLSRHALSLIYEKYVSIVRESGNPQLSFFPVAETVSNRSLGTVYTPQFIARFFARYLNRNLSPVQLAGSKILDPACGSGVFLRCIAEIFTDASALHDEAAQKQLFRNLNGIDIDASAVDAAQLSLSLLHVAHFGEFPNKLSIRQGESLGLLSSAQEKFTAIIANPPFIPWDLMSSDLRNVVTEVLGNTGKGKADAYQAFLRAAIDSLEDDGYLLFVLPQSFLSARSADALRREIVSEFSVEIIADLSNIAVFQDTGAYVILLVARKRCPNRQYTTIVRCRDFPGQALNEALHSRRQENDFFQVFQIAQESLAAASWQLMPSREMELVELLQRHVPLDIIVDVRSGMVSGNRKLFTVDATAVPTSDRPLWPYLLSDREMRYFNAPEATTERIFFPVVNGKVLEEDEVKKYAWTWRLLSERRASLEIRASVRRDSRAWWLPHRLPDFVKKPKIVAPHVALAPRFSYDQKGAFIVTQGPVLLPREDSATDNIEWFALAVLNSALVRWQIQRFGQRYARGYALLEPKTLRSVLVPNPADLPVGLYAQIVTESRRLFELPKIGEPELEEIDRLVLEAFGVPADLSEMIQKVF